jgi:uncharacterized protein YoxC
LLNPDVLVAAALIILAVASILLIGSAVPMLIQAGRTLLAYERLADTLKFEIQPTLAEIVRFLDGINSLRSATTDRVMQVGQGFETVADSVAEAAGSAKAKSSVLTAGLLAALKTYLEGHGSSDGMQAQHNKR